MEESTLRLQEQNKLVAEARKMVEYLRIKRTALYFRERRVDMQTWMLNNLVDNAYQVHGLSSEERKPYLKQARMSSWHLYTDLSRREKPSEGEQKTKLRK